MSQEDWLRSPSKNILNNVILLEPIGVSFPLVGSSLAWQVGDGKRIKIGIDLWSETRRHLPQLGHFYLADLFDEDRASCGFSGWLSTLDLGLQEGLAHEWNSFRKSLATACIKIRNDHELLNY